MARRRRKDRKKETETPTRMASLGELRADQDRAYAQAAAFLWLSDQAQEGLLGTDYGKPTMVMERPDGSLADFDAVLAEEMVMELMERAHAAREEALRLGQATLCVETAAPPASPSNNLEQEHVLVPRKREHENLVQTRIKVAKDIKDSKVVKTLKNMKGAESGKNGKKMPGAEALLTEIPGGVTL